MNTEIYLLAEKVIDAAIEKEKKIALAESCTGGLIAAALTEIAGASAVFQGSAVTYSNEAKEHILGVQSAVLKTHGAVSGVCARQMAEGARRIYGSDIALSVTGIAGPGGGTPEKPVGTVWFGHSNGESSGSFLRHFDGDRAQIRLSTVKAALEYLLKEFD